MTANMELHAAQAAAAAAQVVMGDGEVVEVGAKTSSRTAEQVRSEKNLDGKAESVAEAVGRLSVDAFELAVGRHTCENEEPEKRFQ